MDFNDKRAPRALFPVGGTRATEFVTTNPETESSPGLLIRSFEVQDAATDASWSSVKRLAYDPRPDVSLPSEPFTVMKLSPRIIGDGIKRGSLAITAGGTSSSYSDDGDGVVEGPNPGRVFYKLGIVVIEDTGLDPSSTVSFEATIRSVEKEVVAVVSPNSLTSSSNPTWNTGDPTYVSKIGMYDAEGQLVAVSSPSRPVRISDKTPITFLLRFDA